ncbi:hypothetical protein BGX28_006847 [Mortierella sp. GBA30]|nr:hypothetical protein BGX28_006847 [Mortierella sp. GBA30]
MAYTTVGEDVLYIQGGTADGGLNGVNQFFSLDLTQKNWNTSKPPWKNLSLGNGIQAAPFAWEHTMALSKDKQSLIIYDSTPRAPGVSVFNIANGTWQTKRALPSSPPVSDYYGLRSAVDPSSGLMYIPTGTKDNQTLAYDSNLGSSLLLPNPAASVMNPVVAFYSVVWSTMRNSVLMYGGRGITPNGNVPNPYLAELQPGPSATWRTLTATGQAPGAVERHCMVPAYGGTKMVLFGGSTTSRQSLGSIYILDVKALSWTKGPDVDPSQNRSGMACAVAGDSFIAWGGEHYETSIINLSSTIIFNLKINQWTDQFSLSTSTGSTAGSDPKPSNSGSDSSVEPETSKGGVSGAAIGGGVAGAAVLVAIIALIILKRRILSRKNRDNNAPPSYSTLNPLNASSESGISARQKNTSNSEQNEILTSGHTTVLAYSHSYSNPQGFNWEVNDVGRNIPRGVAEAHTRIRLRKTIK